MNSHLAKIYRQRFKQSGCKHKIVLGEILLPLKIILKSKFLQILIIVDFRPPPQRNTNGGSLLSLIDIDYESFVLLLGLAGAAAAYVLYQVAGIHISFKIALSEPER